MVGEGETIHWVGRQATVETTCVCHLSNPLPDLPPYKAEEQPWFTTLPTTRDVRPKVLIALADKIDIVLLTATDPEIDAVLRLIKPLQGRRRILKGFVKQETYYLGKFGACLAAVTKCRMGSLDSGGATLATEDA